MSVYRPAGAAVAAGAFALVDWQGEQIIDSEKLETVERSQLERVPESELPQVSWQVGVR